MTSDRLCIQGMPYMPGVVRGELHHGHAAAPGHIAIHSPRDPAAPDPAAAAILVVEGAPFSHAMIRLRARNVPIVLIDASQASQLAEGQDVVVDGSSGRVTDATDDAARPAAPAAPRPGQPVRLADGTEVHLLASVADTAGAQMARTCGAGAIGLLRSEFLQPDDGHLPDEAFYRSAFSAICDAAAPLPVTVRLLDVARDKTPPWLPATARDDDALGLHGVRIFRDAPVRQVLDAQLASLHALQGHYPFQALLPSLAHRDEVGDWADYVRQRLPGPVTLGAMAETPAAVLDMHRWFDAVDFVAVGCNDLMQCLFGTDRDRPELRDYLDPYSPVLFRFLKEAADTTTANLGRVRLCGLLPQLQGTLPLLVGLGYRVFSVDPPLVPWLARSLSRRTLIDAQTLGRQACEAEDSSAVRQLLPGDT